VNEVIQHLGDLLLYALITFALTTKLLDHLLGELPTFYERFQEGVLKRICTIGIFCARPTPIGVVVRSSRKTSIH